MLKNSCILGPKNFFLILTLLRVAGLSVSSSISLTLAIIDVEIVAEQLLGPTDLVGAKVLYIYELM